MDAWRLPEKLASRDVPFWNYFLLRFQLFLVYFFAGIKKIDADWIGGHSMRKLSDHWTFTPFRLLFPSTLDIDLVIVHWGGFALDLSVGFLFLHDATRPVAYLLTTLFNGMNSQLFSIGMFPFVMIASGFIFSSPAWPSRLWTRTVQARSTSRCRASSNIAKPTASSNKRGKRTALAILAYMILQIALPFSHSITRGYNTWTNGNYGYSWDMMVHNWQTIHSRVTVVDNVLEKRHYLDTDAFTKSRRWLHHADMVKEFAECARRRLGESHNLTSVSIYIDVWVSLNRRFVQRVYDPRVNILQAEWSPFSRPAWVLPLLVGLENWRPLIKENEERLYNSTDDSFATFVADFPGKNYIRLK